MPNEPRRQVQDILMTCAEPQYRSPQTTSSPSHQITTMTTTGFTAASLTSAYVGCIAIPEDGAARGQARMIKSFVGSPTFTATVDIPWSSSTSVTTVRTWLPSDVPARSTGTGTTSSLTSTPHQSVTNEPDSYWKSSTKGYFLLGYGTNNAGRANQISSFTSSTGVFVPSPNFAVAPADGELFNIRKLLRPEGPVDASVNQKTLTRRIVGQKEADAAVPITSEGTIGFSLPQRPLSASAGTSTAAVAPLEIGEMLQDFMTQTLDTGGAVSSSSTDSIVDSTGTWSVGGFILANTGEAAQILANSSGTLTLGTGQIAGSVTAGQITYASSWYQFATSDFRTRMFDLYRGRIHRQLFYGCFPTVELNVARDQVVTFAFKYTADVAWEYVASDPNTVTAYKIPLIDTTIPVDGKGARFLINGVKMMCGDLKINFGVAPVARQSLSGANWGDGHGVELTPVTFTATALADVDDTASFKDLGDRLRSRDVVQLLYQKGTNPKETFCVGIPAAQLTKVMFAYNGGQGELQLEGVAQVPTLSGLGATVPGFAIGWI